MHLRLIREQFGALLSGIQYRATNVRIARPTLVDATLLILFLIILGLAGAADQHP